MATVAATEGNLVCLNVIRVQNVPLKAGHLHIRVTYRGRSEDHALAAAVTMQTVAWNHTFRLPIEYKDASADLEGGLEVQLMTKKKTLGETLLPLADIPLTTAFTFAKERRVLLTPPKQKSNKKKGAAPLTLTVKVGYELQRKPMAAAKMSKVLSPSLSLHLETDGARAEAAAYYTRVAARAREQGTAVITLTIKGTACRLEHLAKVSATTGGYNDIVDPLDLTTSFTGMLKNPILATHVEVTCKLHGALEWRNELEAKGNTSVRAVGNVTAESTLTFEFSMPSTGTRAKVRSAVAEGKTSGDEAEAEAPQAGEEGLLSSITKRASRLWFRKREPPGDETDEGAGEDALGEPSEELIGGLESLPFQVQIRYTPLDGSKRVRVITKAQRVTTKREEAETELNVAVVSLHAMQEAARLLKEGNYTKARMKQWSNLRMVKERLSGSHEIGVDTKRQLEAFEAEVERLDREISIAQRREARIGVRYASCEDDDSDDEEFITRREGAESTGALFDGFTFAPAGGAPPDGAPPSRARSRASARGDSLANALYQADNPLFSHYS